MISDHEMPQLFQVLKCFKCSVFQVHQTKKSNKWECKLCGEKQSIKRHYGLGTGKECRLHVQKLNGIRGEVDELNESIELNKNSEDEDLENNTSHSKLNEQTTDHRNKESKWSNFVDKTDPISVPPDSESMFLGDKEVVLEIPSKKRKKFRTPKIQNSLTSSHNCDSTETNEPECQQTIFFCRPDFAADNDKFLNANSSKISNAVSKSTIPVKENRYSTPLSIINQVNDFNDVGSSKLLQQENAKEVYVPPKPNKNSKWAQFADGLDENELNSENTTNASTSTNPSKIVPNNLFTLCDESELDDVLDF